MYYAALDIFMVKSFLLACAYHVNGAAVVGVLRQHPDPLFQDVTVVHHNLTHILKAKIDHIPTLA